MDFERLSLILPKSPEKWGVPDVSQWLDYLGFPSLKENFSKASIDGACILLLDESDLKDLEITSSIMRKKLLNWTRKGLLEYSKFLKEPKKMMEIQNFEEVSKHKHKKTCLNQNFMKSKSLPMEPMNFLENIHIYKENTRMEKEEFIGIEEEYNVNLKQRDDDFSLNDEKENNGYLMNGICKNKENLKENMIGEQEIIIRPTEGIQTTFYSLKEAGGKIGRHSANEIVILEESVSRFHAEIAFKNKEFKIRDIGSTTGSFIKIIGKIVLEKGMIIEMGSNQFEICNISDKELFIVIVDGPNVKMEIQVSLKGISDKFSIGRKNNNELAFDDHHLSNLHAKIYMVEDKFILEDLCSTNGSWIRMSGEGEKSEWHTLSNNVIFKIGTSSSYYVNCSCIKEKIIENKENINSNCIICLNSERDVLYMPCRHNATCLDCSKNLINCPLCNIRILDSIKIYRS